MLYLLHNKIEEKPRAPQPYYVESIFATSHGAITMLTCTMIKWHVTKHLYCEVGKSVWLVGLSRLLALGNL